MAGNQFAALCKTSKLVAQKLMSLFKHDTLGIMTEVLELFEEAKRKGKFERDKSCLFFF
jgi:hypothetical protein